VLHQVTASGGTIKSPRTLPARCQPPTLSSTGMPTPATIPPTMDHAMRAALSRVVSS